MIMNVSSHSGNADSSSWAFLAPFEVSLYLRDYLGRLDAQRFQSLATGGDSCTVFYAQHGITGDTGVGSSIKRGMHWGSCGTILPRDNGPWLDMRLSCCTEKRTYTIRVAEIVDQYVNDTSSDLPVERIHSVTCEKFFDRLHVYSDFDCYQEETVIESG